MQWRACAVLGVIFWATACARPVPQLVCRAAPVQPLIADPNTPILALGPGVWGQFDPNVLRRVQSIAAVEKVKLGVAADGRLAELSIYHNDPAPIPRAVRDVLDREFPRHHVLNYETEWEDTPVTEVAVRTAQGRICELSSSNTGEVRYIECLIEVSDLPLPVVQALDQKMPGARIEECEVRQDETGRYYKVTLRHGSRMHQLKYTPEGELKAHNLKIPAVLLLAQ